jgi:hypothetical protein
VAQSTVSNLEAKGRLSPLLALAVQNTLEAAGVEFTNGGEPGVKLASWSKDRERSGKDYIWLDGRQAEEGRQYDHRRTGQSRA